jgi:hypothetical protein
VAICAVVSDRIEPEVDVAAFFSEAVRSAARTRGYDPTAPSAQYVAALLAHYAKPGALSGEALRRPLTLLLREALEACGPERFARLRECGDDALYLSGFFADHLDRRGVARRFVHDLGATAYDAAGAMLRRRGSSAAGPDVFGELAAHFGELATVLGDVADRLHAASARDDVGVLDLYERWTRRSSPALTEALARAGVVPLRGGGGLH